MFEPEKPRGMKRGKMRNYETDVLIIGGGLAGLSAALSAARNGCRAMIVCKSLAGHSGNTIVAGAGISVYNPENGQYDTRRLYEDDLLRSGAGINDQTMVRRTLEASDSVLSFLEENGVQLRYKDGRLMVNKPGGHSSPRYYSSVFSDLSFQTRGLSLSVPMDSAVQETNVERLNFTSVLKLIRTDGKVTGCVCIDRKNGRQFCISAGSVIIAAGGGASLFVKTNNTTDVTCDSYRLALEAGAVLRDMEFVQFYPCVLFEPVRAQIGSSLFADGAVLRNKKGEEFMHQYSSAGNKATRDVMALAVQSEIAAGRGVGNCVYVDCARIDEEVLLGKHKEFHDLLMRCRIDIRKDMLLVSPASHFYLGGICVDTDYSTEVPGLFACGEAVGGLHGANRLPGTALMETVVSGRIAGRKAAAYAGNKGKTAPVAPPELGKTVSGINWKQKIRELRAEAWKEVSIIRDDASIERFINYLNEQQDAVEKAEREAVDTLRAYEYRSYYMTAKMLALCAGKRKESRGAHYRSDYPHQNEAYTGNYLCRLGRNGKIEISFEASNE